MNRRNLLRTAAAGVATALGMRGVVAAPPVLEQLPVLAPFKGFLHLDGETAVPVEGVGAAIVWCQKVYKKWGERDVRSDSLILSDNAVLGSDGVQLQGGQWFEVTKKLGCFYPHSLIIRCKMGNVRYGYLGSIASGRLASERYYVPSHLDLSIPYVDSNGCLTSARWLMYDPSVWSALWRLAKQDSFELHCPRINSSNCLFDPVNSGEQHEKA